MIITHCQGDGIQGEWVSISGDDTYVDITTEYENAGVNYYSNSLGSSNYNTLTSNNSTKTETVNVDTERHKGIKAGTKSSTYSYTSVSDDSTLTAGQTHSTEASGGLVITGGTIVVDTTQSGIKYNGGGGGMGGGSSGSTYSANTAFSIADSSGNVILSFCPDKSYSYVLYSSPELTSGDSYTLYSGGSVSGNRLTDSDYDFRYESCDTSSASVISTTTAGTTVQGGNSRP